MKALLPAFRSLTTPYLPVFYILFSVGFIVLGRRWDFIGDSYLSLETITNGNLWILPSIAALTAFDTSMLTRSGSIEMITTGRKWRSALLLPAVIAGIGTSLAHIALTAALLAMGQVTDPLVGWDRIALTLLVQCLTLTSAALIGAVIGRLLTTRTAGFTAFASVFLLLLATEQYTDGTPWAYLRGAASIPQIGYVWSLPNQLLRITQMLIIVAICIAAVVVIKQRLNGKVLATASTTAALSVALLLGFVLPVTPHKVTLDPQPQADICTRFILPDESELSVCVNQETERELEYTAQAYDYAYTLLHEAGVDLDLLPRKLIYPSKEHPRLPEDSAYLYAFEKQLTYKNVSYTSWDALAILSNFFAYPSTCSNEDAFEVLDTTAGMELSSITHEFLWPFFFQEDWGTVTVAEYEDAYKQLAEMCR